MSDRLKDLERIMWNYMGSDWENCIESLKAGGYVIVPIALITQAIEQAERSSADPYEDYSDYELAAQLRALI